MKTIVLMLLACCAAFQMSAAEPGWITDVPQALAQAKKDNKMVLLDFTGSDWCPACMEFKKEALDTTAFKDYAGTNLVLVELDFPNNKPQSDVLKSANQALYDKYKIEGFPTFIVLNKDGKEIGRQLGAPDGGSKAFLAQLNGFKKKN